MKTRGGPIEWNGWWDVELRRMKTENTYKNEFPFFLSTLAEYKKINVQEEIAYSKTIRMERFC